MALLRNSVVYVVGYLIFMLPTYVLPYFGSNSALINAASVGLMGSSLPTFWYHATALYLLMTLAWLRGYHVRRTWLWIFPTIALAFDMIPGFNWVPLVPTAMHICALIFGVITPRVAEAKDSASGTSAVLSNTPSKAGALAVYAGLGLLVLVSAVTTATYQRDSDKTMADLAKGVPLYRAGNDDGTHKTTSSATPQPIAQPERPQISTGSKDADSGLPPLPFVDKGPTLLAPIIQVGEWRLRKATMLYLAPDSAAKPLRQLNAETVVRPVALERHNYQYKIIEISKPRVEEQAMYMQNAREVGRTDLHLQPGDKLALLDYYEEGACVAWYKGRTYAIDCSDEPAKEFVSMRTIWAEVVTRDGTRGWLKDPDAHGMSRDD